MKNRWWIGIFALVIVFSQGCSQLVIQTDSTKTEKKENDTEEAAQKAETEKEEKPPEHTEFEGRQIQDVLWQGPGLYGGDKFDEAKVKKEIDQFPEGLDAAEYYHRLLSLVAADYRPYAQFFDRYDTYMGINDPGPDGTIRLPEEREVNVLVLLDASGSMAAKVDGEIKMDLAKKSIQKFVSAMPANANVSLYAYGHKGSNSRKDKKVSCGAIEEVYELSPYQSGQFKQALGVIKPVGWTPLAAAMESAKDHLAGKTGDHVQNIVYVVSDGVETCDGDPVKAAKELNQSKIEAVVNIIGFDVDDAGQQALKSIAKAGNGTYASANSRSDLNKHFEKEKRRLIDEWYSWSARNVDELYKAEKSKVDELYAEEKNMLNLANEEEERLLKLASYIQDKFDIKGYEINPMARERGRIVRIYVRDSARKLRIEIRDNARKARIAVRDKSRQERIDLRNN